MSLLLWLTFLRHMGSLTAVLLLLPVVLVPTAMAQPSPKPTRPQSVCAETEVLQPDNIDVQRLKLLIDRYKVAVFDVERIGKRAITRYEFATQLSMVLDRISEQIAVKGEGTVTKADLNLLERLQADYVTELTTIRGQVDALETQSSRLNGQQFSTTTKLISEGIFPDQVWFQSIDCEHD